MVHAKEIYDNAKVQQTLSSFFIKFQHDFKLKMYLSTLHTDGQLLNFFISKIFDVENCPAVQV